MRIAELAACAVSHHTLSFDPQRGLAASPRGAKRCRDCPPERRSLRLCIKTAQANRGTCARRCNRGSAKPVH